jgi:hypothetical protein
LLFWSLLVGGLMWGLTGLFVAFPVGRALCARAAGVQVSEGYVSCQHGGGRLWQALGGAALAFFVGVLASTLWISWHRDASQVETGARRLLVVGFGVGLIPALASLLLAFPYGVPQSSQGPLPLAAASWGALVVVLARALRHTTIRTQAAAQLALLLTLWLGRYVVPQLRIGESLMLMALAFPISAVATAMTKGHRRT